MIALACLGGQVLSAFCPRLKMIRQHIDKSEYPDIMSLMNIHLVLKAIANERRFQILQWLKEPSKHFSSSTCDVEESGVCVGLIEEKIGLSQSTVSQYLQQLQQAELIIMERSGQWTYCKLNQAGIKNFTQSLGQLL